MSKFVLVLAAFSFCMGCAKKAEEETTTTTTTLPTYGMNCEAGTTNRDFTPEANTPTIFPGMMIEEVSGSTITSVEFRNVHGLDVNFANFTFEMSAYACDFAGANIGTSQATVSPFNFGSYYTVTFTFSTPIPVPTTCTSGKKTVVFKMTNITGMNANTLFAADAGPISSTCPNQLLTAVTTGTGTAESGIAYSVTVVAQP